VSEIHSFGELAIRRRLDRNGDGSYATGQRAARVLDPRPRRDRADLAALLSFVDEDGVLWDVTCMRYRDERGWKAIKAGRYTSEGRYGHTSTVAALGFSLTLDDLAFLEGLSADVAPYPFEEPAEDEKAMRRLAHKLVDYVSSRGQSGV
jgi:hypothetical protein